jgi:hypothetical protein
MLDEHLDDQLVQPSSPVVWLACYDSDTSSDDDKSVNIQQSAFPLQVLSPPTEKTIWVDQELVTASWHLEHSTHHLQGYDLFMEFVSNLIPTFTASDYFGLLCEYAYSSNGMPHADVCKQLKLLLSANQGLTRHHIITASNASLAMRGLAFASILDYFTSVSDTDGLRFQRVLATQEQDSRTDFQEEKFGALQSDVDENNTYDHILSHVMGIVRPTDSVAETPGLYDVPNKARCALYIDEDLHEMSWKTSQHVSEVVELLLCEDSLHQDYETVIDEAARNNKHLCISIYICRTSATDPVISKLVDAVSSLLVTHYGTLDIVWGYDGTLTRRPFIKTASGHASSMRAFHRYLRCIHHLLGKTTKRPSKRQRM